MKIGIELNNVVRDINSQILKYYKKDINKEFDDKNVDKNVVNFIDRLRFDTKKAKSDFMYIDYPYEIFGCARTMQRNLSTDLNTFAANLADREDDVYEVCLFSLKEKGLSIQSTYYFLSKIGSRIREMFFPKNGEEMWKKCDVIITTNKHIVKSKPDYKKVVLIRTSDNGHLVDRSDLVYNSLQEILEDDDFLLKARIEEPTVISKLISKVKNIFK
ncbi:MAG: hypothetical protein IKT40_02645 [Bacilli bacterium]|nr:hypothetical protein [Bacilli bacterium]